MQQHLNSVVTGTSAQTHIDACLLLHTGKGSVYDYFVNAKTGKFQPWAEVVQEVQYNGAQAMSSMFVPTAETSSLRFFLDLMVDLH